MIHSDSPMGSKKLILLEDEEVLGKLYTKALEASGHQVMWLKSTEKLVKRVEEFLPDLILLDSTIRGEERSGVELIPDLQRALPQIPIVVLSNYDQFQLEKMSHPTKHISYFLKIDTPPNVLLKKLQGLFSN